MEAAAGTVDHGKARILNVDHSRVERSQRSTITIVGSRRSPWPVVPTSIFLSRTSRRWWIGCDDLLHCPIAMNRCLMTGCCWISAASVDHGLRYDLAHDYRLHGCHARRPGCYHDHDHALCHQLYHAHEHPNLATTVDNRTLHPGNGPDGWTRSPGLTGRLMNHWEPATVYGNHLTLSCGSPQHHLDANLCVYRL